MKNRFKLVRYISCLLFTVLIASKFAIAQLDSLHVRNDKAILLRSDILAEDRTLWIYLPADYNKTNKTYPLLYLLDGEGHFDYASQMISFLSSYDRNRMPDMIVVGIVNVDRGRDFTPVYFKTSTGRVDSSRVLTTAGAGRFLRYLENEVVPYIDKNYRVQPYRILAGHSLGGLFALYAKEYLPNLFPATILMSPAINGVNDRMLSNLGSFLTASHPHNGKLFISIGNENTLKVDSLAAGLKHFAPNWFDWNYRKYEDENHFSLPFKSLYDGLKFIYKDWFIDYYSSESMTYQDIIRHFNVLSIEFGYTISPTEDFVNNCGYNQLRAKRLENAIGIFIENLKNYPNSWNAYDSLGEAYMRSGNKPLAILNYKKSIELNPHNEDGKEMLKKLEESKK